MIVSLGVAMQIYQEILENLISLEYCKFIGPLHKEAYSQRTEMIKLLKM